MQKVIIHTTQTCPYCIAAKNLLKSVNVEFEEIQHQTGSDELAQVKQELGWATVPIIKVGDQVIGGFDDLRALHQAGQFLPLVNQNS